MATRTPTKDDKFLEDYIEKISTANPYEKKEMLDAIADERERTEADRRREDLHQQAISEEQKQQEADAEANRLKAEKERQEALDTLKGRVTVGVKDAAEGVSVSVGNAAYKMSQWATPGGIGLLIVILTILVFTIVQVNAQGDTRMKQFWYMLSGRAVLNGKVTPVAGGIPYNTTPALPVTLPDLVIGPVTIQNPINTVLGAANQFRSNYGGLP